MTVQWRLFVKLFEYRRMQRRRAIPEQRTGLPRMVPIPSHHLAHAVDDLNYTKQWRQTDSKISLTVLRSVKRLKIHSRV